MNGAPAAGAAACHAVAEMHHRLVTGIILSLILRCGEAVAGDAVFRTYSRQHREKFLPGLALLGLDRLPPAVAAAQYHYLSNFIGTVRVEYMYESDRKAWIRYPPPRWIFDGAAICGIPDSITTAMLRGGHARNGEALGNDRLGFVCTGMTTAGDPGLEGYFQEYEHSLAPEERLRLAPDESAPPFESAAAPALTTVDWTPSRLAGAERNYAVDLARALLAETARLLGDAETKRITGHAARLIGMQFYDATRRILDADGAAEADFAAYLCAMSAAMGDEPAMRREGNTVVIEQRRCRILRGLVDPSPAIFAAWTQIWRGACAAHDRRLNLSTEPAEHARDGTWQWRLAKP
jgi:hypothetical protein